MTAPVMQQLADRKSPRWFVRFVMPREWTIETLPRPSDPLVSLKTMPAGTYAAITFSGLHLKWTPERQTRILERFMAREKFEGEGQPIILLRPSLDLPYARWRNEIMIKIRT